MFGLDEDPSFYRSFIMQIMDLLVCMTKMRFELKEGSHEDFKTM